MSLTYIGNRCRAVALCAALLGLAGVVPSQGYESYHDPLTQGAGYCAGCHNGFLGGPGSALHDKHTSMTSTCNLCHTGSGRDNPLTMWSQNNQLGCMGCHGLDYGETIQANYRTFATLGLHKNSGYGLRRHHAGKGVTACADCHDANVPPYGENVINTGKGFTTNYYTRSDVKIGGNPINPCNNEDGDADGRGLDNDGDGLYDAADPDCTGARATMSMLVTATNTVVVSWPHGYDGWHVESSSLLNATWTDVPVVPQERADGAWEAIITPAPGTRFYRLYK